MGEIEARATPTTISLGAPAARGKADVAQGEPSREEALRTVTYLMLVRTALATVLMMSVIVLALTLGTPETLSGPFGRFVFALLATTYVATLAYALGLSRIQDPVRFADIQIGVDLVLVTLLIHATGGAQSGYTFLYLVDVVAVTLLPKRFSPGNVATASALLFIGISLLGYLRILPPITGQTVFPWDLTPEELVFRLVVYLAGVVSVAALGMSLYAKTREARERLARHEQIAGDLASLHQNTIRCLSSGLVTTTLDGSITSMNDAASEILGIGTPAPLGQRLDGLIPGMAAVLAEDLSLGRVIRQEVDAMHTDGSPRCLGVSATPLSDHTGQTVGRVIHFQDLTELRSMEGAMRRSERLAGIGRLAANIAHEIRNPLASISGSVEVLRKQPGTDAEARQLIDIAVREVDRVNGLISGLLDYARPRTEDFQRLDLGEMVTEIAKVFEQERRPAEVRVEKDLEPGVTIEGASGQLRQVLWNLLRNAVAAMPRGGRVRLGVSRRDRTNGMAEAVLSVSDTGIGIPREDLDHIFEPFFSRRVDGTGLGLAITARIVEDHKGTIAVSSEVGKGTTFVIRLAAAT
ncbi:MAG TPA: ATP-binding protein [Polyangia bacterium]|jgi:PAS domain S-box|nr:ATP-binding protein [Polyangia bacterium]